MRPTNKQYREIILGAFDAHTHRTIKEVNEYLRERNAYVSEQSTRRMLTKMLSEGLLIDLGRRGDKNAVIYTKAIFNQHRFYPTLNGSPVQLPEFVSSVSQLDSKLIDTAALNYVKRLILDSLASAYPEPYIAKGKSPVAKELVVRELTVVLDQLAQWHNFIKSFLEAKVWEDYQRDSLANEFKTKYPVIHALIVDKAWENGTDTEGSQRAS